MVYFFAHLNKKKFKVIFNLNMYKNKRSDPKILKKNSKMDGNLIDQMSMNS